MINRPVAHGKGSWVNIGLLKDCQVDIILQEGTRVTVKLFEKDFERDAKCNIQMLIFIFSLHWPSCESK